ncbi:demethoxyubiquinone hydroxylase family protein, partial [Candidatus Venteria ishoeyi]
LEQHLSQLPKQDAKTEAILKQMKIDEKEHATTALNAGGAPLPAPVKFMMHQSAKLMTKTTYWI